MATPSDDPGRQRASALRYGMEYRAESVAYGRLEEMREPRVLYVTFELVPLRRHVQLDLSDEGEPFDLDGFTCRWVGPKLRAEPTTHFDDPHSAAAALFLHLRTWAAWAELNAYGPIDFALRHWAVVDDYPGETTSRNAVASVSDWTSPDFDHNESVRSTPPPTPPRTFETTPLLELLRDRFRLVLDYVSLPSVEAYFVLSSLEAAFGGRSAAASALNVDDQVLSRIGLITATPDPRAGRKATKGPIFDRNGAVRETITDEEQEWLVVTVQELLLRLGMSRHGQPPRLSMSHLPPFDQERRA